MFNSPFGISFAQFACPESIHVVFTLGKHYTTSDWVACLAFAIMAHDRNGLVDRDPTVFDLFSVSSRPDGPALSVVASQC